MRSFGTSSKETLAKLAQSHADLKTRILSLEAENRRLQARLPSDEGLVSGRRGFEWDSGKLVPS